MASALMNLNMPFGPGLSNPWVCALPFDTLRVNEFKFNTAESLTHGCVATAHDISKTSAIFVLTFQRGWS
jgi:hypothetical protein